MGSTARIIVGTTAFALLHSALASRQAKNAASRIFGERNRNAFYRALFNMQSAAASAGLLFYIARSPDRHLWRGSRPVAVVMNLVRSAALIGMLAGVRQVGWKRITGVAGLQAWCTDRDNIPSEPEAQGPALEEGREPSGPFRFTRHPLNFLALPLIWLTPNLTRNRLTLNLLATAYFVLGSVHEEHRLHHAYGEKYQRYKGVVRFFFGNKASKPIGVEHALVSKAQPPIVAYFAPTILK